NPCANGGECTSEGLAYTCSCPSGWTGPTCSEADDPSYTCAANNPCTPENIAAGLFYFPHPNASQFVQCSGFGDQCFEMPCFPGSQWDQALLNCVF
ncbi:MAG: calcium-binding EGF-like domain-containing protein, partial [Nannocystaceae bacterium]